MYIVPVDPFSPTNLCFGDGGSQRYDLFVRLKKG